MSYDIPHRVDILLEPETVELLEEPPHDHPVFDDLATVIDDPDLLRTDEGMELRHTLDAIISAEGMAVLAELADDNGDDFAKLCNALLTVAEPDSDGTLVSEIEAGESRQRHAFDPDFDPFGELGEVTDADIEAAQAADDAMESFIDDLRQ